MKRSVLFLGMIIVLLVSSTFALAGTSAPDPNRPDPPPPNEPILQKPFSDPDVKQVSQYGNYNHTDKDPNIKAYYAIDFNKNVLGEKWPVSFDVLAAASGTVTKVWTTDGKPLGDDPQDGCPVDADPKTVPYLDETTNRMKNIEGRAIYIDHGSGWFTFYFHLDRVDVQVNQHVEAGDVIGTAGCSGTNTIHLHYDLRWQDPVKKGVIWDYPSNFADPPAKGVDLAFAIDTTGSMWDDITAVKTAANEIVDFVFEKAPDSRIALLDFRDFPYRTGASYDYPYHDDLVFTNNKDKAKQAINALSLGYGGDAPETRNCALMHAIKAVNCAGHGANTSIGPWRAIPTKFLVYLTDAPALNPEPDTNFTNDMVATTAKAGGFEVLGGDEDPTGYPDGPYIPYGIAVYPIVVGGDPTAIAEAIELANATGGKAFTAADASQVSSAILEAIEIIVQTPPVLSVPTQVDGQYSDMISFSVSATDEDNAGDLLSFAAVGLPSDLSLADNKDGTATISGILQVTPGTYPATITVKDPDGLQDSQQVSIVVLPEDARATYTGPMLVSTACASCTTATIPLRATIQDISSVLGDPAYDDYPGDITKASVTFVDRGKSNATLCTANVTLLDQANPMVGSATCDWSPDIGSTVGAEYTVGIVVNNYYVRDNTFDDTIVSVYKPSSNFITGGGFLINQSSAGKYAGDVGLKTNFGLNIKFNKTLTNLQGKATIIIRQGGHIYQIKTNTLSSLLVIPYDAKKPGSGTAELLAKANVVDVTDPLNPVSITSSATLQIRMKDNGEPGSTDMLSITLWSKSGVFIFSSNWNGVKTIEQTLQGGNLQVH